MAQNKKSPESKLQINYPENMPIVYCNFASFRITPFDMVIDFGIRNEGVNKPSIMINSRVIMSPQHAKAFTTKAKMLIDNYERDFGTISTEPIKKHDKK